MFILYAAGHEKENFYIFIYFVQQQKMAHSMAAAPFIFSNVIHNVRSLCMLSFVKLSFFIYSKHLKTLIKSEK